MDSQSTSAAVRRRTVIASFMGSLFEWYDFGIYSTTSAIVFNQVFFPRNDPAIGTLLALTTVAVGYFTRPIGAIIFGHFGDRLGRKKPLVVTMFMLGIPTVIIGLLPSYATVGTLAPALLLTCRLLQGIGLGGEYAGAALIAIESVPDNRRGFFGAFPQLGVPLGGALGNVLVLASTSIAGDTAYAAWLWRLPFLFSLILLVYALVVRLRLLETGDFAQLSRQRGIERAPLWTAIRYDWSRLLLGIGARAAGVIAGTVGGAVVIAYITTYLHRSNSISLATTIIPAAVSIPLMLTVGTIADRVGRKRMFVVGLCATAVAVFPLFGLLDTAIFGLMVLGTVIFKLCNDSQAALQSSFLADMFPTEVRYTALSLVYQLSAIIGGLTAPASLAILVASGGSPWPLAAVLCAAIVISALCAITIRARVQSGSQQTPVTVGSDGQR